MDGHLDHPYSDPQAEPVSWPRVQWRVAEAEVAWVVTVRRDGRPHATPMVPVVDAGLFYFHTGVGEVKHANLMTNPEVLILCGDTNWVDGLDVAVEGTASVVTDHVLLQRLAQLYRRRWDGRWQLEVDDGAVTNPQARSDLVMFCVTPTRVSAHDKGDPIGQTTFRPAPDDVHQREEAPHR